MTKSFNPKDWLDVPKEQPKPTVSNKATTNVVAVANNDIESKMILYWVIKSERIESSMK